MPLADRLIDATARRPSRVDSSQDLRRPAGSAQGVERPELVLAELHRVVSPGGSGDRDGAAAPRPTAARAHSTKRLVGCLTDVRREDAPGEEDARQTTSAVLVSDICQTLRRCT
jgi:hypothetical protein